MPLIITPKDIARFWSKVNHGYRGSSGDANGSRLHPEKLKRGEEHPEAKLTEELVREIFALYCQYSHNVSNGLELSIRFGVTKKTILNIAKGRVWKHLDLLKQG